jgi:hypothetical protein
MKHGELIAINNIRMDGGTQPRATIDFEAVFDYMDAMADGANFPPVVVFYDGSDYWLADGFHRVKAAEKGGVDEIACELHQGTQEDAQWYSLAANKTNGLRRTNDDKHRAVKAALRHPKGAGLSDSQIARHVGVDHKTVAAWREKLEGTWEIPKSDKRTGGDGRMTNTAKIGRRRWSKPQTAILPQPDQTVDPAQPEASASEGPESRPCAADRLASYWCVRLWSTTSDITECPVSPKDLAAAIRRGNNNQLIEHLEKTRDFIAAVLADAGSV